MSQPTLESTPIVLKIITSFNHRKTEKIISPFHHSKMKKSISPFHHSKTKRGILQTTRTQNHHFQTHYQRKINVIRRKSVVNKGKMTRQTHHRATILILPTEVITEANDGRGKAIEKRI